MKIHYHNKSGETAQIIPGGIIIHGKMGNRTIGLGKEVLGDHPYSACEHYLVSLGFKRLKIWECTTETCMRVIAKKPCIVQSKTNPSGMCEPYRGDPDVPHHLVLFDSHTQHAEHA